MNYLAAVDGCFLDAPSGSARVAWDVALLLRDRGHAVTLVCRDPRPGAPGSRLAEEAGVRILRYGVPVLPRWHPGRVRAHVDSAAAAVRGGLAGQRWDLVHLHLPVGGLGVQRALGPTGPYVYTMHSPVTREQEVVWGSQGLLGLAKRLFGLRRLRAMEAEVLGRCARVHTLSEYTRRELVKVHGPTDRVTVIPHWNRPECRRAHAKAEARRRLGWPEGVPVLLTVRRHAPRHGLDVAVDALAPLAACGRCVFVVGGDGPLRPALEQRARRLGAGADQVRFPGRLSEEELRLAYEAADLFILPTVALECFGLIILEAWAVGCPVLGTDVGAIPELLRPVTPDFLVPPRDARRLREKAEAFLDGRLVPPPPEELVRHVEESYGRDAVGGRLLDLLEGVAARPCRAPQASGATAGTGP